MKISELSRRSGVPIPTIKYYLRDGLLPPGQATAANQADYGEEHLRRLRLIRTLVGVRRLPVSEVREILGAIEEEGDLHQVLGIVIAARPASPQHGGEEDEPEQAQVPDDASGVAAARALVAEMGWEVSPATAALRGLGEVLDALSATGSGIDWRTLLPYARLTERMAELDLAQMDGASGPHELAERAVVVSVLLEPALLALRRLAQEDISSRLFGGGPQGPEAAGDPPPADRGPAGGGQSESGSGSGR